MKVLLVHPTFPVTYWGFQYSLPFAEARAMLPPLGLITLAALLPKSWELRLVDLNVDPLEDQQIRWADVVFIGGMRVQADSIHEVTARSQALGRRVVVGGPAPTTAPTEFADADLIFLGEAEGRIDSLVEALDDSYTGPRILGSSDPRPDMTRSPIPRFDLLRLDDYDTMSIQTSRGCPYRCEFCDIIEIYGRVPRVKEPLQVRAEIEALLRLGWRSAIFIVDDNFIGNRKAARALLGMLTEFQREHDYPFNLTTEATINLASDERLVTGLVEAGFSQIFVGIESPSPESLKGTQKTQNLRIDLAASVEKLSEAGLEVMAGFIVGFDEDGPEVFEAQRAFIQALPIPIAMAGLLMALPGTQLWRRLAKEGRLRQSGSGDQFARPNFVPTMPEETLLRGYADLLAQLYEPAAYYARCENHARRAGPVPGSTRIQPRDLLRLLQVMWVLGVRRPSRRHFWQLCWNTLWTAPRNLRRAVVHAVLGEHMIRYTREHVLPRLESELAALRAERRIEVPEAVPDEALPSLAAGAS